MADAVNFRGMRCGSDEKADDPARGAALHPDRRLKDGRTAWAAGSYRPTQSGGRQAHLPAAKDLLQAVIATIELVIQADGDRVHRWRNLGVTRQFGLPVGSVRVEFVDPLIAGGCAAEIEVLIFEL